MYTKTTFSAKSNQRFTKIDINFSTLDLQIQNYIKFYLNNALILSFFFSINEQRNSNFNGGFFY